MLIAKQILFDRGKDSFEEFKKQLIDEFNSLSVSGMPKINGLFALKGAFVNLVYPMPCGERVKLSDDREICLGNQVICEFYDGSIVKRFGFTDGMDFLLVSEYGENCTDPQLAIFRKR